MERPAYGNNGSAWVDYADYLERSLVETERQRKNEAKAHDELSRKWRNAPREMVARDVPLDGSMEYWWSGDYPSDDPGWILLAKPSSFINLDKLVMARPRQIPTVEQRLQDFIKTLSAWEPSHDLETENFAKRLLEQFDITPKADS